MAKDKTYKFINIKQVDCETFEKHPVYRVFNNKSHSQLGIISWYTPWRQYVFSSQEECVFNISCLRDVIDFMDLAGKE
jgi:IS4 transposase